MAVTKATQSNDSAMRVSFIVALVAAKRCPVLLAFVCSYQPRLPPSPFAAPVALSLDWTGALRTRFELPFVRRRLSEAFRAGGRIVGGRGTLGRSFVGVAS